VSEGELPPDATEVPAPWYASWVTAHRTAFMLPAEWVESALMWWPTFVSLGVTASELADATRAIQLAAEHPASWGKHLPEVKAVVGRLRNRRAAEARRAHDLARGDRFSVCDLCGDSGWVVVPHPDWVRFNDPVVPGEIRVDATAWAPNGHGGDGEPRFVEVGVACRCFKGRATVAGQEKNPPLTLERYEQHVNRVWREMLIIRDENGKRRRQAERATRQDVPSVANLFAMPR